jgi:hypothetical protein
MSSWTLHVADADWLNDPSSRPPIFQSLVASISMLREQGYIQEVPTSQVFRKESYMVFAEIVVS